MSNNIASRGAADARLHFSPSLRRNEEGRTKKIQRSKEKEKNLKSEEIKYQGSECWVLEELTDNGGKATWN